MSGIVASIVSFLSHNWNLKMLPTGDWKLKLSSTYLGSDLEISKNKSVVSSASLSSRYNCEEAWYVSGGQAAAAFLVNWSKINKKLTELTRGRLILSKQRERGWGMFQSNQWSYI